MDVLYERSIETFVQENSSEKTKQVLNVCICHNTNSTGHRKDLNIRVTNPENAFMLYSLKLTEEDYHNLKTQQGLLIDFPSFPSKFIELLQLCERPEEKFELHLHTQLSTATLQVVEVNPFKHLVHLALSLSTATDSVIKTYLAECLTELKRKHEQLQGKYSTEKAQQSEKICSLEENIIELKSQLQGGERAKELQLNEQSAALKEQMQKEREAALKYQQELIERSDVTAKQLENRIYDLEERSKKLADEKNRFELQNRELIAKVKLYEEERISDKGEIKRLKAERNDSEKENRRDISELHSIKTQLAVTNQELKDSHVTVSSLQEQLALSNTQKSKLESQIDTQHYQCIKLENTVRSVSEEVVKGNEIIAKMQSELKNYRSKLKMKHMQVVQQEKSLQSVSDSSKKQQTMISALQTEVEDKSAVIEKLEAAKEDVNNQLEECQKTLKSNENVIAWLNKQINDKVSLGARSLPSLLRSTSNNIAASQQNKYGAYDSRGKPMPAVTSSPALNTSNSQREEYHHLSSFETRKDDSLLDEMYLKDDPAQEDSLRKVVSETPNSQIITLGRNRKVLQQKQNTSTESSRTKTNNVSFKRDLRDSDPPLMKIYAP